MWPSFFTSMLLVERVDKANWRRVVIGPQKRLQDKNRSLRFEYLAAYCNERYLSTPVD